MPGRKQHRPLIVLATLLSAVFLTSGMSKIADPGAFAGAVAGYGIWNDRGRSLVVAGLPLIEITFALALWSRPFRFWAAAGLVALTASFTALVTWAWMAGLRIPCGCFGPGELVGPSTSIRDAALLAIEVIYLRLCSKY